LRLGIEKIVGLFDLGGHGIELGLCARDEEDVIS
jgi:hypothetical protein